MGKLKTHNPIYNIKDTWDDWFNLTHTFDRIYLPTILYVQRLHMNLHNDDNECNLHTNEYYIKKLFSKKTMIPVLKLFYIATQGEYIVSLYLLVIAVLLGWFVIPKRAII